MLARLVPSRGSEGEFVPGQSPNLWWRPAILGIPGLEDTSLSLRLCVPMAFSLSISLKDALVGVRTHPNPTRFPLHPYLVYTLHLTSKTLLINEITFGGSGWTGRFDGGSTPTCLLPHLRFSTSLSCLLSVPKSTEPVLSLSLTSFLSFSFFSPHSLLFLIFPSFISYFLLYLVSFLLPLFLSYW